MLWKEVLLWLYSTKVNILSSSKLGTSASFTEEYSLIMPVLFVTSSNLLEK